MFHKREKNKLTCHHPPVGKLAENSFDRIQVPLVCRAAAALFPEPELDHGCLVQRVGEVRRNGFARVVLCSVIVRGFGELDGPQRCYFHRLQNPVSLDCVVLGDVPEHEFVEYEERAVIM